METTVPDRKPQGYFRLALIAMVSLGVQVAMGLQIANISPIYQYLGASANLGVLWAAGPVSGLLVQPLIGNASDRVWTRLGRRRPFMLAGTVVAFVALVFMPMSFAVWMAAVLLWALDLSINTTQEPVRALIADIVPHRQRTLAFSVQMMMFNLGAAIGMALPWLLHNVFDVSDRTATGIPLSVHMGFWLGALILLITTVVTLIFGKERKPPNLEQIRAEAAQRRGLGHQFVDVWRAFRDMDRNLHRLAVVQFFTWFGFFTIVIYFTVAVANHVFGAYDPHTSAYVHGTQWGGLMMSLYSLVALVVSIVFVTRLKHANPRNVHIVCLFLGGLGLLSAAFVTDKWLLIPSMVGIGIMWASVMSMPYAILANYAPEEKLGVYFGIFNIFITAPQLVLALGVSWLVHHVLGGADHALWMGGISLLLASLFMFRVKRPPEREPGEEDASSGGADGSATGVPP